jgi:hypothetical protein
MKRNIFQALANSLGRAYNNVQYRYGDVNKNPKTLYNLEISFIKLRNSTLFHNDDTTSIIPQGIGTLSSLKYTQEDPIGFGIQGANIGITTKNAIIPTTPITSFNWNPSIYGPPSPQGFFSTTDNNYSAWKGNQIIDATNITKRAWQSAPYEPVGVNSTIGYRNDYLYPIRWNNGIATYQQIPLWNHAKYLSFFNNNYSPSSTKDIHFTLTKDDLEGIELFDPINFSPIDIVNFS